ncbi:MAG: pyridoxal-phosphate-dependent aminotransferase family protein [Hyphomicrobiaceae bacterium]
MVNFETPNLFGELDPAPRLLMGPGPVDVYPRVLRAMAAPMLGQFDPEFTAYMNETMALYRQVFRTSNQWTLLVNGTARAGIEACLGSLVAPGDTVLVPRFGRFGYLLTEICTRVGAKVVTLEKDWGSVFEIHEITDAIQLHRPKVVALVHGDTSTTMAQPLDGIGAICRAHDALLYVDATATLCGMSLDVDALQLDAVSAGLQKCMSGPPGTSPVTVGERAVNAILKRKHIEGGIRPAGFVPGDGPAIVSNYLDLGMLMDYWGPKRLNHHTESASMLYAARECARVILQEGLESGFARHAVASQALRFGLEAMGLHLFGDSERRMASVTGVLIPEQCGDGEQVRSQMLTDFGIEIGTSFGPLAGKIWRIGTMGYVCRKSNVLRCLSALDAVLRRNGFESHPNAGVDAACDVYERLD